MTLGSYDQCLPSDPCSTANCSHFCLQELDGSYRCECPSGYKLTADGNNNCVDIDECVDDVVNLCSDACENVDGSYRCLCPDGYELDSNDNRTCVDSNECLNVNHGCSHNCTNIDGSFECTCPFGYYLSVDNATCLDVNECNSNEIGDVCTHE